MAQYIQTADVPANQVRKPSMVGKKAQCVPENAWTCHCGVIRCSGLPSSNSSSCHHLNLLNRLDRGNVLALGSKEQVKVKLSLLSLGTLVWLKVNNKVVLDGKDGVSCEPWVVLGVDLSDDVLVVWVGDLR